MKSGEFNLTVLLVLVCLSFLLTAHVSQREADRDTQLQSANEAQDREIRAQRADINQQAAEIKRLRAELEAKP